MTDTPEQVQLRQHLAEMRRAAHGVGKDFEIAFKNLDSEISRLSTRTSKDLKYGMAEIEDDFQRLGRSIDDELVRLPQHMRDGAASVASAIGSGAARMGSATRDAFEAAGSRAVDGTKNAAARIAGVNRKPLKEWHPTTGASANDEQH
ncbi:MAG: hypothetical protein L3J91_06575 [Thermoplasmata archaeon]|nr:hypothetical protein [Thermoplasmata archaeon]